MAKIILLVEDNDDIRYALRVLLELRGFTIIEATDGREALHATLKHAPGLILMDLTLPRVDGVESTRIIRANPATARIPILAVSSSALHYKNQAMFAGCNEVVTKTEFIDNMDALLEKYLGVASHL